MSVKKKSGRQLVQGRLEMTARGFGFVQVEGEAPGSKDVFVSPTDLNGALHGDTVVVKLLHESRGGKREGEVTRIVERGCSRLCGLFAATGAGGFLIPDDGRLPENFRIAKADTLAAKDGQAVLVEILDYGSAGHPPKARVIEVWGDPWQAGVQVRMAIFAAGVAESFSPEALAEAAALPVLDSCEPGREDLRDLSHVTIDGEDAQDFDDAICVEKSASGFTLYVSIADVSHYVRPGTALDREAYRRGTSIYLPGRVLPMLPERLSNDLCSLVPNAPRPAFTAVLHFDAQGRRVGQRFTRSLIVSKRRCTYTEVERLLFQGDAALAQDFGELATMLGHARDLAALLKTRRLERGSLEFDAPESVARIEAGKVLAMHRAARGRANMLIEDCMLAANEAVAETLFQAGHPVLYRIHEEPDPEKLELFADAARILGLHLPAGQPDSHWVAEVLTMAAETPHSYMISNLLLRAMLQARYSPENVGHFGLAAKSYLHFTSPIRRYPDLIAHRVLQGWLCRDKTSRDPEALAEAGLHLSRCERKAVDLERNALARMAVLFLRDRVGEDFAATISGLSTFGLFLELEESGISGAVPMALLPADYYLVDSRRHRLIGERWGRVFQLGDRVLARLEDALLTEKRLVFSLR